MELILELTGCIISGTDYIFNKVGKIKHLNHVTQYHFPLPKESDTPSERVRKTSGGLDYTKQSLVATNYTVFKEVNTDKVDKE